MSDKSAATLFSPSALNRHVGPVLVTWLIFTAIFFVANSTFSPMLGSAVLTMPQKLSLLAHESLYGFVVIVAIYCLILITGKLAAKLAGQRVLGIVAIGAVSVVFLLYLSGWQAYRLLGAFVDQSAIGMVMSDAVQVFQHALSFDAASIGILFVSAIVLAWGVVVIARKMLGQVPGATAITRTAGAVFGIVVLTAVLGRLSFGDNAIGAAQQQFADALDSQTGPISRIVRRRLAGTDLVLGKDYALDANALAPLLSTGDYVAQNPPVTNAPPSILIILIESLRPDQLVSFGGKRTVMPAVEVLAGESVIFPRAYANSSHSNYADIAPLSSQYPLRASEPHFYSKNPYYPRLTILDIAKHLGHKTAIVSSQNEHWGGMFNYLNSPNIDHFYHAESAGSGNYENVVQTIGEQSTEHRLFDDRMLRGKPAGKIDDSLTVSESIRWLRSLDSATPFAMYMNLQSSHAPYRVPPDFPRKFLRDDPEVRQRVANGQILGVLVDDVYDAYSDSLSYVDSQVGRLFDELRSSGRWENTIVILSGDTATSFSGQAIGNGGKLIQDVVHIPLMIKAPDLPAGVNERFVQHVDVPPTVTGLLGMTAHPGFQGADVLSPEYPEDRLIFQVAQTPITEQYAVIQNGWQLVYDNTSKRFEFNGLAGAAAHDDLDGLAEQLVGQLDRWVGAQLAYYTDVSLQRQYYPPVE